MKLYRPFTCEHSIYWWHTYIRYNISSSNMLPLSNAFNHLDVPFFCRIFDSVAKTFCFQRHWMHLAVLHVNCNWMLYFACNAHNRFLSCSHVPKSTDEWKNVLINHTVEFFALQFTSSRCTNEWMCCYWYKPNSLYNFKMSLFASKQYVFCYANISCGVQSVDLI